MSRPILTHVAGNIGVGKSTYINTLTDTIHMCENLDKWGKYF